MSSRREFALKSNRVVTPDGERPAVVVVRGEKIVAVRPADHFDADIVVSDFGDLVISPGIVDSHVHINDPGRTEWEGFAFATAAAAAGGITSLIDMPLNSSPVTTTAEAFAAKFSAACGRIHVDVGMHGGLVAGSSGMIGSLLDCGVVGIKAFLCDSGLDEFPAVDERDLTVAMKQLAETTVPLLAHAERIEEVSGSMTDPKSYRQYMQQRPPEFELAAIELLIDLCRETGAPVHIVHLATADALPLIAAAKSAGLPLTVETCPHYLYFAAEQIRDGATEFKCAPPIRSEQNRRRLCDAVGAGVIDTIGSDHSPCPPPMKRREEGNFQTAWGGIAGLQLSLPVCWTVGKRNGWSPSLLAARMSARPAELFGLENRKGRIAPGVDADFVVWDPDKNFVVKGADLLHRHKLTPYESAELTGVVRATYVRGRAVYSNGKVDGEPGGTILIRGRSDSGHIADWIGSCLHDPDSLSAEFEKCCAAQKWVERMIAHGSFESDADLFAVAESAWSGLDEVDYLQAFSAHPRIGDVDSLREKYSNTKAIAGGEQALVAGADDQVLTRLAKANDDYFEKFGFIFIVCATGKSAQQMLDILETRLACDRDSEIRTAAAEQLKITRIRLRKMIA